MFRKGIIKGKGTLKIMNAENTITVVGKFSDSLNIIGDAEVVTEAGKQKVAFRDGRVTKT